MSFLDTSALGEKVGGRPAWQWALMGGIGIAVIAYMRRKGTAPAAAPGPVMLNPALNFGGGGDGGGGGGVTVTPPTPPAGGGDGGGGSGAGDWTSWFKGLATGNAACTANNPGANASAAQRTCWQHVFSATGALPAGAPSWLQAYATAWGRYLQTGSNADLIAAQRALQSRSGGGQVANQFDYLQTSSVHAAQKG